MMDDTGPGQDSRRSLTNASDDRLTGLVDGASRRVVFVAPGLSEALADALARAWRRLEQDAVSVVLDVDPEVCRLGYGTLEGLENVRAAAAAHGALVSHQPGLRIGLLIADDHTLVFSPTPLLIEAGSQAPERPNAIELGPPPSSVAQDLGLGPRGAMDRKIGLDPLLPERMAAVRRDLDAAPPVKFDLARRLRVFTSRFQFVELEMTGCNLSRRRVSIPAKLMGLSKSPEVERRFQTTFDLIEKAQLQVRHSDRRITESSLADGRRAIVRQYLVSLPGYGSVVLRSRKEQLLEAVAVLRSDVDRFARGVTAQLEAIIQQGRASVCEALLPTLERNPPEACTKIHSARPSRESLRAWLGAELERCFGNAKELIGDMQVTLVFKDVAYESLVDPKFLDIARRAMPGLDLMHLEFDAAASSDSRRCA